MIDIVTVPTAQTVGVGGAADGGSEAASGESGFSDLLGAMMGSAVGAKGDAPAQVTEDTSSSKDSAAAEMAALVAGMLMPGQPLLPQASDDSQSDAMLQALVPVATDGGKMPAVQTPTARLFDWSALPDLPAFKADAASKESQPIAVQQVGTAVAADVTEALVAAAKTQTTDGRKLGSEVEPLPGTDAPVSEQETAQITRATTPRATKEASDAAFAALDASGNAARLAVQDAGLQTTVQATQAKPMDGFDGGATVAAKLLPVGDDAAATNDSQDAPFTLLDRAPAVQQAVQSAATKGTDAAQTPDVQLRQQVIDQVVSEVKLNRLDGRSDLVVKLNPPELGALRIHVAQEGQAMVGRIEAGSDLVRGLLEAHLPTLVGALSNAGLRVDSVSVTTGSSFDLLMQNPNHGGAQQQTNHSQRQSAGTSRETGIPGTWTVPEAALTRTDTSAYSWLA